MPATLKLEIVTPGGRVFPEAGADGQLASNDVEMVTLPGREGELGIYPQHVPLVTQVVPGEVVFRRGSEERALAIGPGFVEITADRVSILTELAVDPDRMDAAAVEAARKAAEQRLAERLGGEEAATVNAAIVHSIDLLRHRKRKAR